VGIRTGVPWRDLPEKYVDDGLALPTME